MEKNGLWRKNTQNSIPYILNSSLPPLSYTHSHTHSQFPLSCSTTLLHFHIYDYFIIRAKNGYKWIIEWMKQKDEWMNKQVKNINLYIPGWAPTKIVPIQYLYTYLYSVKQLYWKNIIDCFHYINKYKSFMEKKIFKPLLNGNPTLIWSLHIWE